MCSCVAPIYAYLGTQLSSFFNTWTPWTDAWTKRLEIDRPKPANGSKHLLKQPTLKSNVTFKYQELQDATGSFCKKNLIGVGGFAKVCGQASPLHSLPSYLSICMWLQDPRHSIALIHNLTLFRYIQKITTCHLVSKKMKLM